MLHNLDWQEVKYTCLAFPIIDEGIFINNEEKIKR